MLVTLINAGAVILGGFLGLLMKARVSENFKTVVMTSAGVITIILGINMALGGTDIIIAILFSLILGGFIGYALKLEDRILSLGDKLQKKKGVESGSFGRGFLDSSILFCSGSMSVVGSIAAATSGDGTMILIKSIMDGFMAIVLAAAYGPGVLLSAIVVLLYQGFFVLTATLVAPLLGDGGINAIASSGGYLLIMIALGLLGIKKVKTANFLPALILAPILVYLFSLIGL